MFLNLFHLCCKIFYIYTFALYKWKCTKNLSHLWTKFHIQPQKIKYPQYFFFSGIRRVIQIPYGPHCCSLSLTFQEAGVPVDLSLWGELGDVERDQFLVVTLNQVLHIRLQHRIAIVPLLVKIKGQKTLYIPPPPKKNPQKQNKQKFQWHNSKIRKLINKK